MIKRFLSFTLLVLILSVALYFCQHYLLNSQEQKLAFSLTNMYLFHFISYVIICLSVEFLNTKLPSQVGYAYLASVFIKIGVFVLVFKSTILRAEDLSMAERLSIVAPMFLFLVLEAIYCGRLMNAQQPGK